MLPTLPHAFEAPLPMTLIWLTFVASAFALAAIAWVLLQEARRNAAARRAVKADPPPAHWSARRALHPVDATSRVVPLHPRGMVREEGDR